MVDRLAGLLGPSNLLAHLLARTAGVFENREDLTSLRIQPLEPPEVLAKVGPSVLEPVLDFAESVSKQGGIKHKTLTIRKSGVGALDSRFRFPVPDSACRVMGSVFLDSVTFHPS